MVRVVWAAAAGCSLFLSGRALAADSTGPVSEPGKSAPAKDLYKSAPGLLDERLKLPSKNVDVPLGLPTPSEPSMSRKDWLKMRDRQEEKQNWMFVEPGQLSKEREEKEEANFLKDKWDTKEDSKKKSWWEYDSKSKREPGPGGIKPGAGGDKKERIAAEQEFRQQMQRDREKDDKSSLDKGKSITSGMELSGKGNKESNESAHQSSELSLKDLFGGGSGSDGKSGRGSSSSAWDLFPTDASSRDRDRESSQSQSRRQEFREFLNASRVSKSSSSDSSTASGSSSAFSSFGSVGAAPSSSSGAGDAFGASARAAGKDSFTGAADFGRAPSSSSFSPGGFGGFSDSGRGSGFGGASPYQQPASRSSYEQREYITPQMMAQPKRRF